VRVGFRVFFLWMGLYGVHNEKIDNNLPLPVVNRNISETMRIW